jgi:hypothetical protein
MLRQTTARIELSDELSDEAHLLGGYLVQNFSIVASRRIARWHFPTLKPLPPTQQFPAGVNIL